MESQLLITAEKLIQETGCVPTLTQLAAAAGISRASAYRIFGDQEALLTRLRERGVELPSPNAPVFRAVREVILERGFDGFSVEEVARRSTLSLSTLNRRFGGREGLLLAFFEDLPPRVWSRRLRPSDPPEEVLAAMVEALSVWLRADGALILAALTASPPLRARLLELRRATLGSAETLGAWLSELAAARGVPLEEPAEAGRAFLGGILGLNYQGPPTPERARWWARTFLCGLGLQ